jgi:hypothetical protein
MLAGTGGVSRERSSLALPSSRQRDDSPRPAAEQQARLACSIGSLARERGRRRRFDATLHIQIIIMMIMNGPARWRREALLF